MVTIGVLALQDNADEHMRVLEKSGACMLRVRRADELEQIEGLIILGGELTTMSELLTSLSLFNLLAQWICSGLPVRDTCTGVIMLASGILGGHKDQRSLGAFDVVVRRDVFGRQPGSYEEGLQIRGAEGGPFCTVFIRTSRVESLGEDVEVLARADNSKNGPIVIARKGLFMACSLHPELGGGDHMYAPFVLVVEESTR